MHAKRYPAIDYAPSASRRLRRGDTTLVEFVGGPRGGMRARLGELPPVINAERGTYRRSVRCADDGALRYVFEEDSTELAHQRWIRPC